MRPQQAQGEKPGNGYPYCIGANYFVRTVTMYFLGRLIDVTDQELVFEDCAWVGDTGRFHEALKTGKMSEVEPYATNPVIVGRGAVIDASPWEHELLLVVI